MGDAMGNVVDTERGAGSRTMADLVVAAAARYGCAPALRYKQDGGWCDVSYEDLARSIGEIGLGLIGLGVRPGSKVAIVAHTRVEWVSAHFAILAAGAVSVSVYQTNSPEECHYVLEHSGSEVVFLEDAEQLMKIRSIRDRLPRLRHVVVFDPVHPADDVLTLDDVRAQGRMCAAGELTARTEAVGSDDVALFMYTSGTTGPPKACVLTHGNYRSIVTMTAHRGAVAPGDTIYLFLPLAHAFAALILYLSIDLGGVLALWEKDPEKIVPNLMEVRPTYFPSVPRMFEKIYTLATSTAGDAEQLRRAVEVGLEVRRSRAAGRQIPDALQARFDAAEGALFAKVRALFGGNIRECTSGAAPIAREILEFFAACGVPVLEGYGLTETATVATLNGLREVRLCSVGRPLPGVEARVAPDGELLLRGPNIFQGYYQDERATREVLVDGWLRTGDLGSIDEDGFVFVTGRKKDIIITAGGKNITPAGHESRLKESHWISQAVVVGDRRPYLVALVTLDPDELGAFAECHGLARDRVPGSAEMRAAVQREVARVNAVVGPVAQIKRFAILPEDLTQEAGELTPSMKVKRNVVVQRYAEVIDGLYAES